MLAFKVKIYLLVYLYRSRQSSIYTSDSNSTARNKTIQSLKNRSQRAVDCTAARFSVFVQFIPNVENNSFLLKDKLFMLSTIDVYR